MRRAHSHGWKLRAKILTGEQLATVLNQIIPTAPPIGAWTCGAVTVLAMAQGLLPDQQLIDDAIKAPGPTTSQSYVETIFEAWKIRHGGTG